MVPAYRSVPAPRLPGRGYRSWLRIALTGVLATGCSDASDTNAVPAATLPNLRSVPLPNLAGDAVGVIGGLIAVSPNGFLAFVAAPSPEFRERLQVVDSTGALIGRLGPQGEGPGEVSAPDFVRFVGDSALAVWDFETQRVTIFPTSGQAPTSIEPGRFPRPVALVGDSLDVYDPLVPEAPFIRRPLFGGQDRVLVATTNPAVDSLFPVRVYGDSRTRGPITYAVGTDRIALARAGRYPILLYSSAGLFLGTAGEPLPPQYKSPERLEAESLSLAASPISAALRERMLHLARVNPISPFTQVRFDSQGRLWVIRIDGNSAVADIFADTQLLGSMAVDCPGYRGSGWDIAGDWLVMSCQNLDPNALSDATLRLYRIEG